MTVLMLSKGYILTFSTKETTRPLLINIDYKERKKVCIYHSDHDFSTSLVNGPVSIEDFYMEIFKS